MKKIKTVVCVFVCLLLTAFLAGCSLIEGLTETTLQSSSQESSADAASENTREIDTSLGLPEFVSQPTAGMALTVGSSLTLDGTATSPDGGEITYQWYVNNVDSNGGGTPIEGATGATYTPDTSEVGIKFYYVVVSNNHGDTCNMATSSTACVEVVQSGEWATDEFGGTRYMYEDGTYPVSTWLQIGADYYRFDESGYRTVGWFLQGEAYIYFDEEGRYQPETTVPEGYYVDENGNLVQQAEETTEEEAVEEAAAE